MKRPKYLDTDFYARSAAFRRIGNRAVREAQEENRRLGIPNVFSRAGRIYYELPNGEITTRDPFGDEGEDSQGAPKPV